LAALAVGFGVFPGGLTSLISGIVASIL
jgi:hypothetical protein